MANLAGASVPGSETAATSGQLGVFLLCLAALLAIAYFAKELLIRKPSVDAEFATKEEVQKLELEMRDGISDLNTKIDTHFVDLNTTGERRASEIHERVNEILSNVSEIRGELRQRRRDHNND